MKHVTLFLVAIAARPAVSTFTINAAAAATARRPDRRLHLSTSRGTKRFRPGRPTMLPERLKESPRHGGSVDVELAPATARPSSPGSSIRKSPPRPAWSLVIPPRHRGMADLTRAVGDQLAQDGFIAIVPDFLSGKGPDGGGTASLGTGVGQAIQALTPADVKARLDAAMEYGKKLPASNGKTGVVGFCWGGARRLRLRRDAAGAATLLSCITATHRARPTEQSTRSWRTSRHPCSACTRATTRASGPPCLRRKRR